VAPSSADRSASGAHRSAADNTSTIQPRRLPLRRVAHHRHDRNAVGQQGSAQCKAGASGSADDMNRFDHCRETHIRAAETTPLAGRPLRRSAVVCGIARSAA